MLPLLVEHVRLADVFRMREAVCDRGPVAPDVVRVLATRMGVARARSLEALARRMQAGRRHAANAASTRRKCWCAKAAAIRPTPFLRCAAAVRAHVQPYARAPGAQFGGALAVRCRPGGALAFGRFCVLKPTWIRCFAPVEGFLQVQESKCRPAAARAKGRWQTRDSDYEEAAARDDDGKRRTERRKPAAAVAARGASVEHVDSSSCCVMFPVCVSSRVEKYLLSVLQ